MTEGIAFRWSVTCKIITVRQIGIGGESPRTIRAWCSGFRYCPDPLGIVTAKQFAK